MAGEESGDIHASKLVHHIKKYNPNIEFYGHGGDRMEKEGVQILEHIKKLAMVALSYTHLTLPTIYSV